MRIEKVKKLDLWGVDTSPSGVELKKESTDSKIINQIRNRDIINLSIETIDSALSSKVRGNSNYILNKGNVQTNNIDSSFFRSELMDSVDYVEGDEVVYERAITELIIYTILNNLTDYLDYEFLIRPDISYTPQWCSMDFVINNIIKEARKRGINAYRVNDNEKSFVFISASNQDEDKTYIDKIKGNARYLFKSISKKTNLEEYAIINISLAEIIGNITQVTFLHKVEPLNKEYKEYKELINLGIDIKREIKAINSILEEVTGTELMLLSQRVFALNYCLDKENPMDLYNKLQYKNPKYFKDLYDEDFKMFNIMSNYSFTKENKIKFLDELYVLNCKSLRNLKYKTIG